MHSAQSIQELVTSAAQQLLEQGIASAQLDSELLLANCLQYTRATLRANFDQIITPTIVAKFANLYTRRLAGEPLAYILGQQEFWSLPFIVTPDTLIPRPETEHLVELALTLLPANQALAVADLGTGSGAIAIALAKERPRWQLIATDQSAAALAVAKENAQRLVVSNIEFYQGDWCQALPHTLKYEAIISNPPYIAAADPHLHNLCYEPERALVAGLDGLADLRKITGQAKNYLKSGGYLLLEHGYDQSAAVKDLLNIAGYTEINTHRDLAGFARLVSGQFIS